MQPQAVAALEAEIAELHKARQSDRGEGWHIGHRNHCAVVGSTQAGFCTGAALAAAGF